MIFILPVIYGCSKCFYVCYVTDKVEWLHNIYTEERPWLTAEEVGQLMGGN